MGLERPSALARRLKLGREEFCQRLLTSLVLGAPYPKWNTHSTPTARGRQFLRDLRNRSFADVDDPGDPVLVDEYELLPRHDDEAGGAPDYAVLWPGLVWMIELKTEKGSHRSGQLTLYSELGRHHHPDAELEMTYLTPRLSRGVGETGEWSRFAHLTWDDVIEPIEATWANSDIEDERAVCAGLVDVLRNLENETPSQARRRVAGVHADASPDVVSAAPAPAPATTTEPVASEPTVVEAALELVAKTAEDHQQRGLDARAGGVDELQRLRIDVRDRLCAGLPDSPLRHVRPWIWSEASGGAAMTAVGMETGYELRFSHYQRPVC